MKTFKDVFGTHIEINKISATLANAEVALLDVNTKERKLFINLKTSPENEKIITPEEIKNCESLLIQSGLQIKSAKIEILNSENKAKEVKTSENTNDIDVKKLISEFTSKSSVLKKVFKDFSFETQNDKIKISVIHGAKGLIEQKNIDKELAIFISQNVGHKIEIEINEKIPEATPEVLARTENNAPIKQDVKEEKTEDAPKAEKKEAPTTEIRPTKNILPQIAPETASLLYGKIITKPPISIREIDPQMQSAVIWGDIFLTDFHDTKDGKNVICSIYITDYTGSIIIKIIENKKQSAYLEKLKKGTTILIDGTISEDKYEHEAVIRPKNINFVSKIKVVDNAPKKRVELHLHTNMSAMDGINTAYDLINRAASWGQPAVAITDHGVAQAYPEAMNTVNSLKKSGKDIKVLYGVEAYFVNDMIPIVTGDEERALDGEFICFDLETTGLNAVSDKIIEIGAVRIKNNKILDEFCTFVDPETSIPERITEITGITGDMVKGAPKEREAMEKFMEFCGSSPVLVAHNANFDVSFIKATCKRLGIEFSFTFVDSVPMSRCLIMSIKNHKLDTVAKYLKIPEFNHHRASDDARALANQAIYLEPSQAADPLRTFWR